MSKKFGMAWAALSASMIGVESVAASGGAGSSFVGSTVCMSAPIAILLALTPAETIVNALRARAGILGQQGPPRNPRRDGGQPKPDQAPLSPDESADQSGSEGGDGSADQDSDESADQSGSDQDSDESTGASPGTSALSVREAGQPAASDEKGTSEGDNTSDSDSSEDSESADQSVPRNRAREVGL